MQPTPASIRWGRRLRARRGRAGLRLADVAAALGMSESGLWRYESGERRPAGLRAFDKRQAAAVQALRKGASR